MDTWDEDFVSGGYLTEDVSVRWPHPERGPYWITVKWCLLDGKWECIGLGIDFAPGARVRGLLTSDLRKIRMGDVLDAAAGELASRLQTPDPAESEQRTPEQQESMRALLRMWAKARGEAVTNEELDRRIRDLDKRTSEGHAQDVARYVKHIPESGRTAPVRITDDLLQDVADLYSAAYRDGRPPTKAVQEHFGGTHQRAARWVYLARKAGKLPPTTGQGKARGTRPRRNEEGD